MHRKVLRVSAYARVSTDKEDQANSLASQRKYFAEYITSHRDWKLNKIYYDEGISGTQTQKRAGFQEMIRDAMNGKVDLILTKEVSRFSRNTVDTLSYTRQLKDIGVGVLFTIDNIDTRDLDGELRLTIMASIAQEESRKTSERVKWGQKRRMEQGVVFGRDLLGYTVNHGVLTINEEEAPIVRTIFHKYVNEGKGTCVIARELKEAGIRPKRVNTWSNTVILRVLRNEKYVGDLLQKKTFTPNYLTHAKKYNRGDEEMVYLENHHEPIIDRELWNRAQEELKRRSPSEEKKVKYSNRYWCSGKVRCAECGRSFVSRTKKLQDGSLYKAWRCLNKANHGKLKKDNDGTIVGCDNNSVNDYSLKTCMNYCLALVQKENISLKKEILQEIAEIQREPEKEFDTRKIQGQIEALESKKRKAVDLMLEGILSIEDLKKQTDWYDEELNRLDEQLRRAEQNGDTKACHVKEMKQYIKALDSIMDVNGDSELLYREILDHIDVHQGNVIDVWLKDVPMGIQLKIKTSGKREFFKTEILDTSFIEKSNKAM